MANTFSKDFDEFVKRQRALAVETAKAAEEPIDWNKQRDDWIAYLTSLYNSIREFLNEYIQRGEINVEFQNIGLSEEFIGSYTVDKMIVRIGQQQITFTPAGTLLIGTKGRVDVEGSFGKGRLLLLDKDATSASSVIKVRIVDPKKPPTPEEETKRKIEWTWKIVSSPPEMKFIELNKESLMQLLMEVSNA